MTPSKSKKVTYKLDDLRPLAVSVDCENAILGGCIESPSIFSAVIASGLSGDDFSTIHNRTVWNALLEMKRDFAPIDLISLLDHLGPDCDPAAVADFLHGVVINEKHILHYVKIVRENSDLRGLARLGAEIEAMARAHGAEAAGIREFIQQRIGGCE